VSAGRKNIIINGDMRIAQRGTTSTIDNNYGCVDRWFKYANGDTSTWGQATDPVHGTYVYWVAKSNGYGNLRQRIEPFFVPTEGINFTASFWMKINSGTAPLRYEVWNNSDGSQIASNMNHDTLTTEWKKYTINFTLDSNDSMDNWHLMLGSNGAPAGATFYLTKCQIERGDNATEFEHRSYGEELALCQRYYQRLDGTHLTGSATNDRGIFHAHMWTNTNMYWIHHFSPSMRTGPSLQLPSGFSGNWFSGGASKAHSTMGLQHSNEDRAELSGTCTSQLSQGNSAWFRLATANDYVAFNAEI